MLNFLGVNYYSKEESGSIPVQIEPIQLISTRCYYLFTLKLQKFRGSFLDVEEDETNLGKLTDGWKM